MAAFIGDISALEYWKLRDRKASGAVSQAIPRTCAPPTKQEIARLGLHRYGIVNQPLHLIVASQENRRARQNLTCHVISNHPRRSFIELEPSLYLATPEACFLHLAAHIPLMNLILIGFELCGSYALNPRDPGNGFLALEPRMTSKSLQAYLARAGKQKGIARARKAASFLVDGSASPRETALVLLLCLPTSLGGYGLPAPRLNHPITVSPEYPGHNAVAVIRCDLYWPGKAFELEYDSDLHHSGASKINKDLIRRSKLELRNIRSVSVTNQQIHNPATFDELARVTARYLGKRLQITRKDALIRRLELRRTLFHPSSDTHPNAFCE